MGTGLPGRAMEKETGEGVPFPSTPSLFPGWLNRSLFLLPLLLVVLDCSRTPHPSVAPSSLVGVYVFDRSGQLMGRDWSVESTITIDDSVHYEMELVVTTEDDTDEELEVGKYRVSGATLVLTSDRGESTDLTIRGDSLIGRQWSTPFSRDPPVYVRQKE